MPLQKINQGVIWLTGLSGAGKTTLASALQQHLHEAGYRVQLFDGDELRAMFPDTGFDRESRHRHILRAANLASNAERDGKIAIVSLISPYRESRAQARAVCRKFVEVYVDASLAECERRDPKGLYRRARAGEVANFTGIGDVYEPPLDPEIRVPTTGLSTQASIAVLLDGLEVQWNLNHA